MKLSAAFALATLAFSLPSAIHAATVISPGVNLSWNEVWTKENSPHVIEGPTQVRFGSLSIGSGRVVNLAAAPSLRLHGTVVVPMGGTAPDPEFFPPFTTIR